MTTEVEAALLEGSMELPKALAPMKTRYDELNTLIAELEAEKEDIKLTAGIMADQNHVSMFTVNGVNAFGFQSVTRTVVDTKSLQEKYPEVAAIVISNVASRRFYSKKLIK